MSDILILRRRFCLEMAEQIASVFKLQRTDYDVDEAADLIDSLLPNTRDEQLAIDAEIDETIHTAFVQKGPGLGERLREALNVPADLSLKATLETAMDRARECEQLRAALLPFGEAAGRPGRLTNPMTGAGLPGDGILGLGVTVSAWRRAAELMGA